MKNSRVRRNTLKDPRQQGIKFVQMKDNAPFKISYNVKGDGKILQNRYSEEK